MEMFKYRLSSFIFGSLVSILFIISLWSFTAPWSWGPTSPPNNLRTRPDPKTFYDDPDLSYTLDGPVKNWDQKRKRWVALNPGFSGSGNRVIMVTGSQPGPCKNPVGDHLLLRLFKNKVDYCRIHGHDIWYNNVLLHQEMHGFWAKYAAVRAAMVAHPEAEWVWWVDSDAVITDMDFSLPLERYKGHNLVVHGWAKEIYGKRSWTGLNAGVLLIRNCQWSMDLLDRWAEFGPQSPDYEKWGRVEKEYFKDKLYPESDDQTALAYLLVEEKDKWADKVYLEGEYYLQGYWVEIVSKLDRVTRRYAEMERGEREGLLSIRHAEKDGEEYRTRWQEYLDRQDTGGFAKESWRRPFITHFTGCEQCSGEHNENYFADDCWSQMGRALNFADNQVLRNFGFFRPDLRNTSKVVTLPS